MSSKPPWQLFDFKALKGQMLFVKHATSSKTSAKVYTGSNYHFNSSLPAKRQRIQSAANYDRMFVFADLTDPPNCFAIFTSSPNESSRFLEHTQDNIGVGRMFYIIEPDRTTKTLGATCPVVSTTKPLCPLKFSIPSLPMTSAIGYSPMTLPKEPGEMLYFADHNVVIELSRFEVMFNTVSCSGYLCDRAHPVEKNAACGCMFTGDQGPCVGEYTLTIPVPTSISSRSKEYVPKCRSLRTTRLFFDNLSAFGKQTIEKANNRFPAVRKQINDMAKYINEHDGWTIVGWFKRGEVEDQSSSQGEKVESSSLTLHVSLLIPTNKAIANGLDPQFQSKQIVTVQATATATNAGA